MIGTLFGILLLPILIILLLGFTYLQSRSVMQEAHARSRLAEQQARLARSRAMMRPAVMSEDEAVTVDAADDSFTPAQPAVTETRSVPNADAIESPDGTVLRPVLRTVYETQQQTIQRAVTDPTTGETQFVTEKRPVVVPRTITEYVAVPATRHSAEVIKLVEELRKMGEEDPQRATKLSELKDLLLEEFSERHAGERDRTHARTSGQASPHASTTRRGEGQDRPAADRSIARSA